MSVFSIKTFEEFKASLLNYLYYSDNTLTDFNVGSVARSMMEAMAMEGEELYFRTWQGVQSAIREAVILSFEFEKGTGSTSTGSVKFKRDTVAPVDYIILEGTKLVSADGIIYTTTEQKTLTSGLTEVTVAVVSSTVGLNTVMSTSGTELQMLEPVYGISDVETTGLITGGTDEETQQELMTRFSDYINSLSRSTLDSVEYGALSVALLDGAGAVTEEVKAVRIVDTEIDNTYPAGEVVAFIDNGSGTASGGNLVEDGGLEGSFPPTGWTANSSAQSSTSSHFGAKSCLLTASGSSVTGAQTNHFTVDELEMYHLIIWNFISAYSAGNYKITLRFYDSGDSEIAASAVVLDTFTQLEQEYVRTRTTVGPGGAIAMPAGTTYMSIEQAWDTSPTGTAYMDDVWCFKDGTLVSETYKIVEGYVQDALTKIEGYKAAGVKFSAIPITKVDVDINITVVSNFYDTVQPYIERDITAYFATLAVGADINYEKLIAVAFNAHVDVTDITTLEIDDGTPQSSDYTIEDSERAILVAINFTEGA